MYCCPLVWACWELQRWHSRGDPMIWCLPPASPFTPALQLKDTAAFSFALSLSPPRSFRAWHKWHDNGESRSESWQPRCVSAGSRKRSRQRCSNKKLSKVSWHSGVSLQCARRASSTSSIKVHLRLIGTATAKSSVLSTEHFMNSSLIHTIKVVTGSNLGEVPQATTKKFQLFPT